MIHHVKGNLTEVNPALAVVECSGIGYAVNITLSTYASISDSKQVLLYVLPIYKEDSQTLYGFAEKQEREVFRLLISVSGVGGNTARLILSSLSTEEVASAIANEEVAILKSVKGVGARTAERIIVDLKNKLGGLEVAATGTSEGKDKISEASTALEVLGYPTRVTERLLTKLYQQDPGQNLESLIKSALKQL